MPRSRLLRERDFADAVVGFRSPGNESICGVSVRADSVGMALTIACMSSSPRELGVELVQLLPPCESLDAWNDDSAALAIEQVRGASFAP